MMCVRCKEAPKRVDSFFETSVLLLSLVLALLVVVDAASHDGALDAPPKKEVGDITYVSMEGRVDGSTLVREAAGT